MLKCVLAINIPKTVKRHLCVILNTETLIPLIKSMKMSLSLHEEIGEHFNHWSILIRDNPHYNDQILYTFVDKN